MTDLSIVASGSIDLVWAGQVVEHISQSELAVALQEIRRVLRPDGLFCFDTPNGILTRIQSPTQLTHPEHKKEYTPTEMRDMLAADFVVEEERGLVPMPATLRSRQFSYEEMVLNANLSERVEHSYIMYFRCRPRPRKVGLFGLPRWRRSSMQKT